MRQLRSRSAIPPMPPEPPDGTIARPGRDTRACSAWRGRIEAVAARDKPNFVWKVTLRRKNVANAYCLPGGKIVVYAGILPITRNDAGLATVLGHEVAHATAEHVAERIERGI